MKNHLEFRQITYKWPAIKGFLAGSLIIAGLINPFSIFLQIILFVAGIFIFIDTVIPQDDISIMSTIITSFVGGILTIFIIVFNLLLLWIIILALASLFTYYKKFFKMKKK